MLIVIVHPICRITTASPPSQDPPSLAQSLPAATARGGASYAMMEANTNACSDGSEAIMSLAACRDAAMRLGYECGNTFATRHDGSDACEEGHDRGMPNGCYLLMLSDGFAYVNFNAPPGWTYNGGTGGTGWAGGTGASRPNARPICRATTAMTTVPPYAVFAGVMITVVLHCRRSSSRSSYDRGPLYRVVQ